MNEYHAFLKSRGIDPSSVIIVGDDETIWTFGGNPMAETQKKTERMEARLTPAQKEAVRAALMEGETLTSFVEDAIAAHMDARGAEYPRNAEGSGTYQKKS